MKKFFKLSFLPLLVLLLAFSYLSASEEIDFEQEVNEGDLLIYFVNELKEYVHIPSSIIFSFVEVSSQDQESTAVLGTDQETLRVDNATSGEVELTASLDVTNFLEDAKWLDGENSYLAYSEDEGISGGLELDPVVSLIETQGCEEEVVSRGSTSRFTPTTSESIDIFTTTGGQYCRYDLTGIDLTQTIPGRTPAGNYSLDMVLTLTGGSKWIPEYTLEYIAGDNGSIIGESLQTVSYSEDGSEVTADPDADYHFLMWSDLREDNPRIDTNVTEDISVEAIFESESNPYFLNAYSSPSLGGNVEIQGDTEGLFYHEDEATVIASTSPGYEFIGWSDSNEIVSESSTYVFTMTGNRTLVAEFELEEYELTIISGSGGSTEPSSGVHTYTYGQEVIVYSLPEVDYEFTGWSGDCSGLGDCNLTMTEDKSVSANFEMSLEPQNLHVVSYTSSSGGSVLPSLRVVSSGGTSSSPNVSTNPSYEFVNFSVTVGSGNGELNVETGEVTDVQGDMTIQANFTSFDPCEGEGSIEIGGKSYSLVGIGNQCWMQENLNYSGHSSGQSWCYGNNSSNCDTYGRLYNWEAAVTACPSGTTLPTDADWQELEEYLGMSKTQSSGLRWRGVNEEIGNKLKTVGWGSGTNSSIFTALPGGWRYFYGGSGHVNVWWDLGNTHLSRGKFWSSSEVNSNTSWYRGLQRDENGIHRWPQNKGDGYSVRCLFGYVPEWIGPESSGYPYLRWQAEGFDIVRKEVTGSDTIGGVFFNTMEIESKVFRIVETAEQLNAVRFGLTGNYIQMQDIDLAGWSPWIPIGETFSGEYNFNGNEVKNIFIDTEGETIDVGLFASIGSGGKVHNGKVHGEIKGHGSNGINIGILCGLNQGLVSKVSTRGLVTSSNASANGGSNAGGLVGRNGSTGIIKRSVADVEVQGIIASPQPYRHGNQGGGLVGFNHGGVIEESIATGLVESRSEDRYNMAGGLVGYSLGSSALIKNSYALGNAYAYRNASDSVAAGGFVAQIQTSAKIENSYSIGVPYVTRGPRIGGFCAVDSAGVIISSFYDQETSGLSDTGKGQPKTTAEMQNIESYLPDWDFESIWAID
jgi:uncharacterized protein (TIGR02145 family)